MGKKTQNEKKVKSGTAKSSNRMVDIKKCIHPRERSRFWLVMVVVVPISLLCIIFTDGIGTLIVPFIMFMGWIVVRIFRAYLLGSCAEVSADNFPEIYEMLERIRSELSYPKKVEAYVFQDGNVNTFLLRRFRTRIILLPHGLLVGMLNEKGKTELKWALSRVVGHLKAKHMRFWWLNILIESFEKLMFLNLLIYPWERATQYSGDRIGLACCADLGASLRAINKLMLGNEMSSKTTLIGALKQRQKLARSFFGWVAECLSTHPHLTNRIASLINWSNDYSPAWYEEFMGSQPDRKEIEALLARTE